MSFLIGIGIGEHIDHPRDAGAEAAKKAVEKIGGLEYAKFAVVFASSHYDQKELLEGINSVLVDIPTVGCTAAGVIVGNVVYEESVGVMVIGGEGIHVTAPIKIEHIGSDMRATGKAFGQKLKEGGMEDLRLALIFSDALSGNGTELVRGVFEIMGGQFALTGGAAGDDMDFKKTYQYWNNAVFTDTAVGIGIGGNINFATAANHGWRAIGIAHKATKTNGTTLIELDGKPAFSVYQDYFGDHANDIKKALSLTAVTYPLGMKTDSDQIMIRVPLAVKDDGSIVCGAEVLEGSEIRLMIGTREDAISAAEETIRKVINKVSGEKRVLFISDCVARKILFGTHKEEELTMLKNIVGENTKIFGFYSYGQIAPLDNPPRDVNTCDPGFYEQSISLASFGERYRIVCGDPCGS